MVDEAAWPPGTEMGPRSLGNRSILAPPTDRTMHDRLNRMKRREAYRPVSPVCLEEEAPRVFSPGRPDPYMLFDYQVRSEWRDRLPAVTHLDGSARLQTTTVAADPHLAAILCGYAERTGVPVLCNTSANGPGRELFPDVRSAMQWGEADFVWSDGVLYSGERRSWLARPLRST